MQVSELPTPLPKRPLQWVLKRFRHPALLAGIVFCLPMLFLFSMSGVLYPRELPPWVDNPLELTGGFLMMAVLPAFLLMVWVVATRLSNENHVSVSPLLDNVETHRVIAGHWAQFWPLGILFGLINLSLNTNWDGFQFNLSDPFFMLSACTFFGQLFMWVVIGLVLFFAFQESLVLNKLGGVVRVDLYGLDRLNGFGRMALNNFLTIAGALALTTLQSLDQEFRWYNYRVGLLISIPAAIILVPLPIWRIHLRIRAAKQELLGQIDQEIGKASTVLHGEEMDHLNALLLRRDHVQGLRSWPMNLTIATRFMLYAFIVPMAWAGAALMEVFLDSVLGL